MNTIPGLINAAYTHWNEAERLGRIGMEMESRSRFSFARTFLTRAIELAEGNAQPEWYVSLAFANFRDIRSNYSEAGETSITDGIEATDSAFLKASYIAFMEDPHTADRLVREAKANPAPDVQFALGNSLVWIGRGAEALPILRLAVSGIDSELPRGIHDYLSAMCWLKAQGYDIDVEHEILYYTGKLIEAFPESYNAYGLRIQAYQTIKAWDRVREAALETLRIFPDEETTMLALGAACDKLGDEESAIQWYNRAIGAKPSFARVRLNLASIYERRKDMARAEEIMREIPVAFPEYQMGRIFVAYFLDRAGKQDEARQFFHAAYARLRPHEKAQVEHHPQGKNLLKRETTSLTMEL